jgi:hypothetical protein
VSYHYIIYGVIDYVVRVTSLYLTEYIDNNHFSL